tara:strand:+ start:8853 stop:10208 length:1356 start_codon:yes stop_codon:yes gene_type:complete
MNNSKNNQLKKRSLDVLWNPCSQMQDYEKNIPLIPIKKAKGVWLYDFDDNKYLDAVSSWWVNVLGHCNETISNKIKSQLDNLEHVILSGFTHEPIVELSEKLVNITPKGLDKCFYADNGSSAIEVSLKMSYHYWLNSGHPHKNKFIAFTNGYHGETLGALAISDVDLYKKTYKPLLMEVINAPYPDDFHRDPNEESSTDYCLKKIHELEVILEKNHNQVSAIIIEPLVQCAGGMRMHDPIYLKYLKELCSKYKVHLILDEIAVGFGRTGTMFACEQAGIYPDFMCLSKGITGGYLPLSVCLTSNEIYNAFYDDYNNLKAFLHSHSYTGNPLACAAALATIDIFKSDNIIEKNKLLAKKMHNSILELYDNPNVIDIRQKGMILAIELGKDKKTKEPFDWQKRYGIKIYQYALKNNVLLRPLGNVVYFMPPYVISEDEITYMGKIAIEAISKI